MVSLEIGPGFSSLIKSSWPDSPCHKEGMMVINAQSVISCPAEQQERCLEPQTKSQKQSKERKERQEQNRKDSETTNSPCQWPLNIKDRDCPDLGS